MDPGFYSHTEYWFENCKAHFYPQDRILGVCEKGYRLIIERHINDGGHTLLAINIGNKPRPSRKYAKHLIETILKP